MIACAKCSHFKNMTASGKSGECRRYPAFPIIYTDDEGEMIIIGDKWPIVSHDSWCGEFRGAH